MYEVEPDYNEEGAETPTFGPLGSGPLTDDVSDASEYTETREVPQRSAFYPESFKATDLSDPQTLPHPVISSVLPITDYKLPSLAESAEIGTPVALPPGVILKTPSTTESSTQSVPPLKNSNQNVSLLLTTPFGQAFPASTVQPTVPVIPSTQQSHASQTTASPSPPPLQPMTSSDTLGSASGSPRSSRLKPALAQPRPATLLTPPPVMQRQISSESSQQSTSPEYLNTTAEPPGDLQSESGYVSCASRGTKEGDRGTTEPCAELGICDIRHFAFFIQPSPNPTFPFYGESVLQIIRAVKPSGENVLTLNGTVLSGDHMAMLASVDDYMHSLQDFSLKEALTYVSETIQDLISTVLEWAQVSEDEEPVAISGHPLWDTIYNVINPYTGSYSNLALRFLCFNSMSIEDTVGHMLAVRFWLCTRGFRALDRHELSTFLQTKGFCIAGHDRLCHPILICRLDRLCKLAANLAPMPNEGRQDLLTLYGAYWFFFFRQYLYIDSCVEGLSFFIDLGDVESTNEQLSSNVGPVIRHLLYLFPMYVTSFWIVDSSKRRTPDEAVRLVLGIMDPFNNKQQLKAALQIKCLFDGGFENLIHDIEPSQRQVLYMGIQPSPVTCDLPIAYIDGPPAGQTKHGENYVRDVLVSGDLRPSLSCDKPPPILPLRNTCVTDVAAFLRSSTAAHHEQPLSSALQPPVQKFLYDVMFAHVAKWGAHGLAHNAVELFRVLKVNGFHMEYARQALSSKLTDWCTQISTPLELNHIAAKRLVHCVYWHGRDRKYRPVLVVRVGALARAGDADTAIQLLLYWLQFAFDFLFIPGLVDSWNVLADVDGMSSFKIPALMSYASRFTRDFPDRLARLWVYNAGFLLRPACDLVFKSPKVEYVTPDSFREQMAPHISATQVERRYGGSAKDAVFRGDFRAIFPPFRK